MDIIGSQSLPERVPESAPHLGVGVVVFLVLRESAVEVALLVADVGGHAAAPLHLGARVDVAWFELGAPDGVAEGGQKVGSARVPRGDPSLVAAECSFPYIM